MSCRTFLSACDNSELGIDVNTLFKQLCSCGKLVVVVGGVTQMKFDLLSPKQSACILYFWCEAQRICAAECKVGSDRCSGCSAQSCNQRVVQLQANHRHRWPRIGWEERQGRVKTGHNKRNQEHIIIRHNYVAVGSGRRGGQGDGCARQDLCFQNGKK